MYVGAVILRRAVPVIGSVRIVVDMLVSVVGQMLGPVDGRRDGRFVMDVAVAHDPQDGFGGGRRVGQHDGQR